MLYNTKISIRFYVIIIITFILGLCFLVIAPITTDDGWNFHIFDNYIKSGELYLSGFEVKANFSRLLYVFESYLLKLFGYSFSQLSYNLLFGFFGIISACLISIRHFKGGSQFLYIGLFILFFYSTFYLAKTRPESVYVNVLYLIYYILSIHLEKQPSWKSVVLISILVSFCLASHPNGFFAILLIILYFQTTYKNSFSWPKVLLGIGLVSALSFLFLFYGISTGEFFSSVNQLKLDSGHAVPFYKEYIRYIYFISNNSYIFLIILPILVLSILNRTVLLTFFKDSIFSSAYFSFSFKALIISIIFLFLNPAKWDTYFVLVFPFLIDFIVNLASRFRPLHINVFIFSICFLILFKWFEFHRFNEVSLFNKSFCSKDYDVFINNSKISSNDSSIFFVQNGVYPLYRLLPNVNLFWLSSNEHDINIPRFKNNILEKELKLKRNLFIISTQSNIGSIYNGFEAIGSFKFNGETYYKYERKQLY